MEQGSAFCHLPVGMYVTQYMQPTLKVTWRPAEAEFIIIYRNNIKLFHFTIFGDRKIFFFTYISRICLDSAAVWANGRCHATTFPRFNSPQQMVISSYFLFLRIFHFPFSFNSIYFYLGWSLSAQQGLKWRLPRYPRPYWQQRSVSPKQQDNGKHCNFERFVQRQYTLAEKCFSRIVMYIPPMSDSSL